MDASKHEMKIWPIPLKIVAIYIVYSIAWIFFSDQLIAILIKDSEYITKFQTIKGFLYVAIYALILYGFLWQIFYKIKHSELKLNIAEAKWQSLLQNAPDLIMTLNRKGKILFSNRSINGRLIDKVETIYDYTHPKYHKLCQEKIEQIYQSQTTQRIELPLRTENNKYTLYEIQMTPIQQDSGVIGVLSFSRDISERRATEKEISMLAQAVKSITECVTITDLNNKILFVNDAFQKNYGFTYDEIIGKQFEVILSKLTRPSIVDEILPKTLQGGWQGELFNCKKDGTDFPVFLSTSVVTDEDENPVALIGVSKDISEKKQFEAKLRQAQKLQSLGTLAGGIAHDFNNILGIIMGYASLLEEGEITKERLIEGLSSISKAVDRGSGLVQQILTFARKSDASFIAIKVKDAIYDIVRMAKETFPKKISFSVDLKKDLPSIMADHNQLYQAFLNLFVNARDAMPDGGRVAITVETVAGFNLQHKFPEAENQNYICIQVSDQGMGIDGVNLSRIFEPFYTTKKRGQGTGLGLSVVYGIITSHHGFVDVESQEGAGSTFKLYIPAVENETTEQAINDEPDINELNGDETILLVEDEEMLLDIVKNLLEDHGYHVITATDGEEAVRIYSKYSNRIDLVLTDLGLPILDGWQAFLKMKEFNPEAKVVLASGYLDPEIKAEINEINLKHFIQKPYRPVEVLQRIRSVFDTSLN
jgi:PAS domain S-box-containing protein